MFRVERIILILCLTVSVGRFALDSYLPSLPAIANYFGNTSSETELTLTLYLLGFGVSQFFYGPLGDRFGRRIIILISLVIFIISGIVCTFADSLNMLLCGRLLSGVGAGAATTLSRAMVADTYHGSQMAKAWSQVTTAVIISLTIAPLMGGYVQDLLGWRYNFLIPTLYGIAVLIVLCFLLPETIAQKNLQALKFKTIVRNYFTLLTHVQSLGYILCYTLAFAGLAVYFQLSPFLLIRIIELSPSQYGWLSLLIALSYISGGMVVSRLGHKLGINKMLLIGMSLLVLSGVLMFICDLIDYVTIYSILIPSVIYVIGARIIIPNAVAGSLGHFKHMAGYAAAFAGGVQMLGSSLISYIVTQFHYKDQFLLAFVYIILGVLSLFIFSLMHVNKRRT